LPGHSVKSGYAQKEGSKIKIFDLYHERFKGYFDSTYDGSQAVKKLRETPATVHIIIISGSEDILTEIWTLYECCSNEEPDYDKPGCGRKRFDNGLDLHQGNFKVSEIKIPQVLLILRTDMEMMQGFLDSLIKDDSEEPIFFVLYLNIGESSSEHASPELGLARFLSKITNRFEERLLGYEVNTVKNPGLVETRGKL